MTNREWLDGLSKGTTQEYLDALRAWLEQEHEEPAQEEHQLRPGDIIRHKERGYAVLVTGYDPGSAWASIMGCDGDTGVGEIKQYDYTGVHLSAFDDVLQELKNAN